MGPSETAAAPDGATNSDGAIVAAMTDPISSYQLSYEERDGRPENDGAHDSYHAHTDDEDDEHDDDDEEEEEIEPMSLTEMLYGTASYHAVAKPVTLTMCLAALSAVYVNTEMTLQQGSEAFSEAYEVWKVDDADSQSVGSNIVRSFVNSLVIVTFLGLMTFGIVLLYKYRFMKCLIGYMILTSATLLGAMGGQMWAIAVEKYRLAVDVFSYYFTLWNFAVVGTIAVFFQLGVPSYITQGYLVCTSVILAWQLSHFDDYMAWTLLVALALYDLCAVLSPMGPLKALVNEMQQKDAPQMPGLLYEAELPDGAQRPQGTMRGSDVRNEDSFRASSEGEESDERSAAATSSVSPGISPPVADTATAPPGAGQTAASDDEVRTVVVPLAIAKLYRLPLLTAFPVSGKNSGVRRSREGESNVNPSPLLPDGAGGLPPTPEEVLATQYTPKQMRSKVEVQLPPNGGRIEMRPGRGGKPSYVIFDRHGVQKRVLVVDSQGQVFEVLHGDGEDDGSEYSDDDDHHEARSTIKLGLGDFVFYSVLVAKAALYSFTTAAACMLVILAGLGGTLILLSVYHHALPALPISIFLGVVFYVITRLLIEPWVHDIMRLPMYV